MHKGEKGNISGKEHRRKAGKHRKSTTFAGGALLVDDNGLEPLTLRTSSECSTS
jgi:hypothetical protein